MEIGLLVTFLSSPLCQGSCRPRWNRAWGRERADDVTKPYSEAFKQKMVLRLIGKDAVSATVLARETGVRQQNLSRWLTEARSLPKVPPDRPEPEDVDRSREGPHRRQCSKPRG